MQAIGSNCDWTDKEYIKQIIEYAQIKDEFKAISSFHHIILQKNNSK